MVISRFSYYCSQIT